MKISLIGFDSMGVRSMATFVESEDLTIFIDPAVSLAPRRFSLPPHELEWRKLREVADEITAKARESDVIVITHYHYDHHDPGKYVPLDIYEGKTLILKDPRNKINVSQKIRASKFIKLVKGKVKEIIIGDGRKLALGKTLLEFSPPYPHGISDRLGYVIEVFVADSTGSFLFTSDVEGPIHEEPTNFIIDRQPDVIVLDGPPTYLSGYRFPEEAILKASKNIGKILSSCKGMLVVDHHLLRDINYKDFLLDASRTIPHSPPITAAEFMGREPELLEARRPELYGRRI
jgi:predicted metallo-beta-lactamase superfamily hydrolase